MDMNKNIIVIGSGVIGMTTALCLAKNGHLVTIVAKDNYASTTSAAAAALWGPFKAEPKDKVAAWAERTLNVFHQMQNIPEAGIVWREFSELLMPDCELPWWHASIEGFKLDEGIIDLPVGPRKVCHYNVPIIDTSLYLAYLKNNAEALGVQFEMRGLASLDEAFSLGNTVINCSGIGAVNLVNDNDLHPARGQIIRIKRKPHHVPIVDLSLIPRFAHITPRINDTIIGGTYDEGVFDTTPDAKEVQKIIARCQAVFPELGEINPDDIISTACGLRPVRSKVRVEEEPYKKGRLFHNYGHGGAGYTLSWGCAEEIAELV